MAYTNIDRPDLYFNTVLYTGNGSTQSISGVNFKPDFTWIKDRTTSNSHYSANSIMGANISLPPNGTNAEITNNAYGYMTSFDSDGFSLTNGASGSQTVNFSGDNYVSWNWLAGGTASSNTDGSITSSVSANTDSGFSIVSYTGNATAGATVGHGLGVTPSFYILKSRSTANTWYTYNKSTGATKTLPLNTTDAELTSSFANSTEPTSSVFSLGSASAFNGNGDTFIAYCFAEKKGYSKFGSYTGNGNADGTFVYTGFKPAWVMYKRTDTTTAWFIHDNKRNSFNVVDKKLEPNASSAEVTSSSNIVDFVSNGFKLRGNGTTINNGTLIYMAFAQSPFTTSTGIPTTAR